MDLSTNTRQDLWIKAFINNRGLISIKTFPSGQANYHKGNSLTGFHFQVGYSTNYVNNVFLNGDLQEEVHI